MLAHTQMDVTDVSSRLHEASEDGHAIKLLRAIRIGRQISKPYEDKDWVKIKGDEVWEKIEHMVPDSIEAPGPEWARAAAFANPGQVRTRRMSTALETDWKKTWCPWTNYRVGQYQYFHREVVNHRQQLRRPS
jgi:hypothetical protein